MIASRVGVLATSLMIDNKIKGIGLAAICALSLNGCDRNSSTVAINPTAPSSMSLPSDTTAKPSQANPKSPSATIVIDDSSFIANSPPLPTASQTASIITNSANLVDFQYAYMAIIQIMHQDLNSAMHAINPDVLFAQGIAVHHQAAINMAKIQLEHGKNPQLRKLAEDLITAQQNEIQLIRHWLSTHPDSTQFNAKTKIMQQEFNNGMNDMHEQMMAGVMNSDPDIAFAQSMLPHHKGALALAQVEIKYGNDEKMRQLADNIIETQQDEIQLIQYWLAEHNKQ